MLDLPFYISITFILATAAAVYLFYRASHSRIFLVIAIGWLILQAIFALTGFYINEQTTPPRFPLAIMPVVLPILALFRFKKGRQWLDGLDMRWLVWLHTVRIPLSIVLFWLFQQQVVPRKVTFLGWNYDILIGLSAPLIAWLVFRPKGALRYPKILLAWNLVGLATLLILATMTLASLPTELQSLSFKRPMVGVLYFPFIWMASGIFPLIFLAELVALRRLSTRQSLKKPA